MSKIKIINLPGSKQAQTDAEFYQKLEVPPGITHWMSTHPENSEFRVFADPVTGKLAGIVRMDLYAALLKGDA